MATFLNTFFNVTQLIFIFCAYKINPSYSVLPSIFTTWTGNQTNFFKRFKNPFIVNFGPQHPAAHGVLRLILKLQGEVIVLGDAHIGLLHRGTELLMQTKHYDKNLPYLDRFDYVSMACQEHAYCLAVEAASGLKSQTFFTNFVRILFDELTRILNHMLAIACHALDVGSMSSIFWAFEEREKIMEFYERVSGARMHAAMHRPFTANYDAVSTSFINDILFFVTNCNFALNEMHNVLTFNKIWKQRLINIGAYGIDGVRPSGLTGPLARCVGFRRDLRLNLKNSYSGYLSFNFKSYTGLNGDCFDRYVIRMLEMVESLEIVNQVTNKLITLKKTAVNKMHNLFVEKMTTNCDSYNSMEDLIHHFVRWHSGVAVKQNLSFVGVESPKGEFFITVVSNNSALPARVKARSPALHSLQFLPKIAKGHFLADLATLIGTIDIVFGEIDR